MLHEICDAVGTCIWKARAQISRSCTPLGPAVEAVAIKAEVNCSAVSCMPKHRDGDMLAITVYCSNRPIYLVIRMGEWASGRQLQGRKQQRCKISLIWDRQYIRYTFVVLVQSMISKVILN